MKIAKKWLFGLLALFLSCTLDGDKKYVDYKLYGTWESTDTTVFSGTLEIGYDTIMITGYAETQTPNPKPANEPKRPFKDFGKNAALPCYTEEGKLFIQTAGGMKGIPYTYSSTAQGKILLFSFGNPGNTRDEVLERKGN